MINICANYINQGECALALSNQYNIKLISLFLLLILSIYLWYISKKIDKYESTYNFFLFLIGSYIPIIFIISSPIFAILLDYKIDFNLFLTILFGIYLIGYSLGFGLLLLFAKNKIYSLLSKENLDTLKETRKYKNKQ